MKGLGFAELSVVIFIVFIVIGVSSVKRWKNVWSKWRLRRKTKTGVNTLAWIIAAETIIEGVLILIGYFVNSYIRHDTIIYFCIAGNVKLLIALGFLKGKNIAWWSWMAFGIALFALSQKGTILSLEVFKYFWMGSLVFLLKKNVRDYFWHVTNNETEISNGGSTKKPCTD